MPTKSYNPYTPSRRQMTTLDNSALDKVKPQKSLTKGKTSTGGRNTHGHITTRFRGGGHKRRYRQIDFKRNKHGVPAKVATIEYDPNRSARIALLNYADGEKRYILAPAGLEKGMTVMSGPGSEVKPGNTLPLSEIPPGIAIHNLELTPGRGGATVRSAGAQAMIRAKEGRFAQVRMPSGEIRLINQNCLATIGAVGNADHLKTVLGKAGKKRYLGKRPHVRGVVMNPVDHPMGGGEGRTSGGGHPVSPWGQLSKGYRTRKKKKSSNKFIVQRRKK